MAKLPVLSGIEIIKALKKGGFSAVRQKGSHVILEKSKDGKKFVTVVPLHREVDPGTLLDILRQAHRPGEIHRASQIGLVY